MSLVLLFSKYVLSSLLCAFYVLTLFMGTDSSRSLPASFPTKLEITECVLDKHMPLLLPIQIPCDSRTLEVLLLSKTHFFQYALVCTGSLPIFLNQETTVSYPTTNFDNCLLVLNAAQHPWSLVCTQLLAGIQSSTNLGIVVEDFIVIRKVPNQLTLRERGDLSEPYLVT